jgi:MFS family permease
MSDLSASSLEIRAESQGELRSRIAILGLAGILGFVGSLTIQSTNLRLQAQGVAETLIGVSTAIQAAGIIFGALLSVAALKRASTASVIYLGCLFCGCCLIGLVHAQALTQTTLLRFGVALGAGVVLTTAEYVLIARSRPEKRARTLALYAIATLAGNAAAPGLISLMGADGSYAMLWAAGAIGVASLAPYFLGIRNRLEPISTSFADLRLVLASPALFYPAFAFGMLDGGLVEFVSLYLVGQAVPLTMAARVAAVAVLGALLLQYPLAYLSDRVGHARMLMAVWMAVACALLGLVSQPSPAMLMFAAFLLGGATDALYSIGFASLADRLKPGSLSLANGCFVASCGAGEVVGPLVAGVGLQSMNGNGFIVVFLMLVCVGFWVANTGQHSIGSERVI